MRKFTYNIALLWLGLCASLSVAKADNNEFFEPILEINIAHDAQQAAQDNKLLMIMFTKSGCGPCARMHEHTLVDPQVKDFYARHMLAYDVNIFGDLPIIDAAGRQWTEKTYAKQEAVWATPALYFFDGRGEMIYKHVGYLDAPDFLALGTFLVEHRPVVQAN